jgi:hypothetical protein
MFMGRFLLCIPMLAAPNIAMVRGALQAGNIGAGAMVGPHTLPSARLAVGERRRLHANLPNLPPRDRVEDRALAFFLL